MKVFLIFVVLTQFAYLASGQPKSALALSVSAGWLNTPYYAQAFRGGFYNFGFDYYLSGRHLLSVNYHSGSHDYLDIAYAAPSVFLITPMNTNAKASYRTFSLLFKYKLLDLRRLSLVPSVGVGLMTHIRNFPVTQGPSTVFYDLTWTNLVFPLGLEVAYKVSPRWQVGMIGGLFIHPRFPLVGYHAGPRLAYVLR